MWANDINCKYFNQRHYESLQLSKGHMKHGLNNQSAANRIIRAARLRSPLSRVPFCDGFVIKPKSDASSIYQGLVILLPVFYKDVMLDCGYRLARVYKILLAICARFWHPVSYILHVLPYQGFSRGPKTNFSSCLGIYPNNSKNRHLGLDAAEMSTFQVGFVTL